MFQFLKQIFLYIRFLFVRATKRRILIDSLASKTRTRELDIPKLPAVLDEVTHLPDGWQDDTSFVGFDSQSLCIRITTKRKSNGHMSVRLDLDILGKGHFRYEESDLNR